MKETVTSTVTEEVCPVVPTLILPAPVESEVPEEESADDPPFVFFPVVPTEEVVDPPKNSTCCEAPCQENSDNPSEETTHLPTPTDEPLFDFEG